jgi:hypothetical protein
VDGALALYEQNLAFWKREGKVNVGIESLRLELAPLAGMKLEFQFAARKVARSGNLALIYDEWRVAGPRELQGSPIQIVWRQPGKPLTVKTGSAS